MPVVRYHNGTTWNDLPLIGRKGPPGVDGAVGPMGPEGAGATTDYLVARAGDTMTGELALAADPVVPLGAATKQYVDGPAVGGLMPNMHGTFEVITIPAGVSFTWLPIVPRGGYGLTMGSTTDVKYSQTGFYLVHAVCRVGYGGAASLGGLYIRHQSGNSRGGSNYGPYEDTTSATCIVWGDASVASPWFNFAFHNVTGAPVGMMASPGHWVVRYLGANL